MVKYRKFRFNKLGRDGVLEKWAQEKVIMQSTPLTDPAFSQALLNKLEEETKEVIECANQAQLQEELADVLEIVYQIAGNAGISLHALEEARKAKFAKYGGWQKKLFVEWVQFPEGHPIIDYCLKNPDRFPEIKE